MATCRFCQTPLARTFLDLGLSPLSNSYLREEDLDRPETFYPLHARACDRCGLVQLPEIVAPEQIFSDYAYFSSYSDTWLEHARLYAEQMTARFGLGARSQVIEVASNDGYLLRWFRDRGIPVLGVEPAANVAAVAEKNGIPTRVAFFGTATARGLAGEGLQADLLLGNNVLAHVPDLNDFVGGLRLALKPGGVLTMEFPHLLRLMAENQFDTIYHEHYSYLSFRVVERVFAAHGLEMFDVEELATHGGSLRVYARHQGQRGQAVGPRVRALLEAEDRAGIHEPLRQAAFAAQVHETKRKLLTFLIEARRAGKRVVGYGAPAKGNTLLNYCGIRADFLDYTVDRSPHKQGLYLPGTHLPIFPPDRIRETRPDYVLVLPWNLRDEVRRQMADIGAWGGRFVTAIPEVAVHGPL